MTTLNDALAALAAEWREAAKVAAADARDATNEYYEAEALGTSGTFAACADRLEALAQPGAVGKKTPEQIAATVAWVESLKDAHPPAKSQGVDDALRAILKINGRDYFDNGVSAIRKIAGAALAHKAEH